MRYSSPTSFSEILIQLHSLSATGTITLLSGQPKDGVSVEARSESKGYYEETVTDTSGSYRLRGLHPDTTYVIKVVKKDGFGSTKIERASPESVTVKVNIVALFYFIHFLSRLKR